METPTPIQKMKKGTFYQINQKDVERLANRLFQKYDRDASKQISNKEIRGIFKDIYKGINPKKKFSDDEIKDFFNLLDKDKDGAITEKDFQLISTDYFVNEYKQGAMDLQVVNPELYELNKMADNKNKKASEVISDLYKTGTKRFGEDFVKKTLSYCEQLWTDNGYKKNQKYGYDSIFKLFEVMYTKIAFLNKKEKLLREDFQSLLEKLDYDGDGKIAFEEFQLYYLRGLLGC